MPLHRQPELQSAHDVIRRLSAVSAELASCLDAVILELHKAEPFEPDPGLVRCAQNLAATQVAITQQILLLTRLIETDEQPTLFEAQPQQQGGPFELLQAQTLPQTIPGPERETFPNRPVQALPSPPKALPHITQSALEPVRLQPTQSLHRAARIYAAQEPTPARLGPSVQRAQVEPSVGVITRILTSRLTVIIGLIALIVGLWSIILSPGEPTTAQLVPGGQTENGAAPTSETDPMADKLQQRLSDTIESKGEDKASTAAPEREEAANVPASTFTTAPLSHPTVVVMPPAKPAANPEEEAIAEDAPSEPARPAAVAAPAVQRPVASDIKTVKPPATTPKETEQKIDKPAPVAAKPKVQEPAAFKTTVKPTPQPVQKFAPVILVLRDGKVALQIYQDLQKRHPAVLGGKTAELRSFTGTDQTPWVKLLAVPSVSKEEAEAICQQLGSEGKALGCNVVPY
ncbi:MAG: hypothetical protein KDJ17_04505 [Hyphomicrobiaceae bacterium]|nr:hypothetical protein [Hyphomicrobiaceae bacterium]